MTLQQLLSTLESQKVVASVYDSNGNLVTELKASTYASLEDELEAREVEKWSITSATTIKITLKEETEP